MKKNIIKITVLALLTVMICAMLVACGGPNANPDKAKEALKENGYVAEKIDSTLGLAAYSVIAGKVEAVVTGVNEDGEAITIFYYENVDDAKETEDKIDKLLEKYGDDDKKSDWVAKRSGKMIYIGTKQAVRDAK